MPHDYTYEMEAEYLEDHPEMALLLLVTLFIMAILMTTLVSEVLG